MSISLIIIIAFVFFDVDSACDSPILPASPTLLFDDVKNDVKNETTNFSREKKHHAKKTKDDD